MLVILSLVFSKMFYCSTVWSSTSSTNINKLQLIQNFACRIITGSRKHEHVTPLLHQLNWLSVSQTLHLRDTIMAHKCANNLAPDYLGNKLQKRTTIHDRATRHSNKLQIPFYRSANSQRTFAYRAVSLLNSLSSDLVNLPSVKSLKHPMKDSLRGAH